MTTTRTAIVLAGGFGTRLAGVLSGVPKALAPIAGRPFLDWQLEYLETQGIERAVLAVGHLSAQIVQRYGERLGAVSLVYAHEPAPLGTGGAIRFAMAQEGLATAFALNGDTMLPMPLHELEGATGDDAVIAVRELPDVGRYGALALEGGRVTGFREKARSGPGCINAGVYWLRRSVLERWPLPSAFSLEHDLFAAHVAELHMRAVLVRVPFIDIGTPESLAAAQVEIPEFWRQHLGRAPPHER